MHYAIVGTMGKELSQSGTCYDNYYNREHVSIYYI